MNPGNRYTRLTKVDPRLNNGTVAGGLAYALEKGLNGYAKYKADQEAKAKKAETETRLASALTEMLPAPKASQALTDDPLAAGGAPTQAGYDTRSLAAMLLDPDTAPVGQMMIGQMFKEPDARKTAQDASGYLRYLDDGTRVFPDAQAPMKHPASVQEFLFAQQNGYGGDYASFLKAKSRATNINVNTQTPVQPIQPAPDNPSIPSPGTNPYSGLPPKVANDVATDVLKKGYQSIADDEAKLVAMRETGVLFDRFEELQKRQETGGFLRQVPGAATIEGAFDPEIQEMNAIADKVTPQMRQGLPGSASDRDTKMFRGAAPGPDKLPEVNRALIQAHRIQVQNAADRLAFRQEYLAQNKTLSGADEQWNKYLEANPIFANSDPNAPELNQKRLSWRDYFSGASREPSAPGSGWSIRQVD